MPGYHYIIDLHYVIQDASHAALAVAEKTHSDVVGKDFFKVFYDGNSLTTAELVKASIETVKETKSKHDLGVFQYLLHGRQTYWRGENSPILDEHGNVILLIVSVVDVTAEETRKAALAATIKDRELLRVITDNIPSFVGYMDLSGTYVFANQSYSRHFGVPIDRIIGHKWQDFTSAQTAKRALEAQARAMAGEVVEYENSITSSEGREVQLYVSYIPDRHPSTGAIRGVVTVGHDVTELKKAIELRDEFLSIASHELRTPLTALQLQMHMTRRLLEKGQLEKVSPDKLGQLISSTSRSIQRITRLIDDMLDITRINSGQLTLRPEPIKLKAFILETQALLYQILPPNTAPPVIEVICEDDSEVFWDRYRVEQVIINLLTNAVRYGAGRPVKIIVEGHEDILIRIIDQGIGIGAENLERIFKRFERAVDSKSITGLGLGLYICEQIVTLHGGSVKVQSTLGVGSTFEVTLPLRVKDH